MGDVGGGGKERVGGDPEVSPGLSSETTGLGLSLLDPATSPST